MSYSNPNLEYRLLCAFRSEQNHQQLFNTPNELFTDQREALFAAYKQALQTYGNLSIDSIEAVYGKSAPDEVYVPIDIDVDPLIDNLRKLQRKRELKLLAEVTERISKEHDPDITPILDLVQKQAQITKSIDGSVQSGTSAFLTDFGNKIRGEYKFLSTGIKFLDSMLSEWCRGEITAITARSGHGKSALMGDSALIMAQQGHPVCIVSLEMRKSELISRWVSALTGIDNTYIRNGRVSLTKPLPEKDMLRIEEAVQEINRLPIKIIDDNTLTFTEITLLIQQYHKEFGIDVFFIDYLQLMPYEYALGKHYGLSANLIALKAIAKKYGLSMVILAQKHNDEDKIKDCGDVENHIASWLNITLDNDVTDTGIRGATFTVLKNRHGRVGSSPVLYNSRTLQFVGNNDDAYNV